MGRSRIPKSGISCIAWCRIHRIHDLIYCVAQNPREIHRIHRIHGIQKSFLLMTNRPLTLPICLYGDNNGAIALSKNPEFHPRTKHIDIRYRFVTELVTSDTAIVRYIPTANMIADGFTCALPNARHLNDFQTLGFLFRNKWLCSVYQRDFDERRALKEHSNVHVYDAQCGRIDGVET